MNYITVKLTEDQAETLYFVVNTEVNNAIGNDTHYMSFMGRIRTKLAKAMREAYAAKTNN